MNNVKINVVILSEVLRRTQLGQNVKVELHFALSLNSVVSMLNILKKLLILSVNSPGGQRSLQK